MYENLITAYTAFPLATAQGYEQVIFVRIGTGDKRKVDESQLKLTFLKIITMFSLPKNTLTKCTP